MRPTTKYANEPLTRNDALYGAGRLLADLAGTQTPGPPAGYEFQTVVWTQATGTRWEGWAWITTDFGPYQFLAEYRPDLCDHPTVEDPDAGCRHGGPWLLRCYYPPCAGIGLQHLPDAALFTGTLHNAQTLATAYLNHETSRVTTKQPRP